MVTRSVVVSISEGNHRAKVQARRDGLVTEYIHLVLPIARRMHAKLPASFELDDLIGAGNFGLVAAATRYRPETGVPFEAYAKAAIAGHIKDTFRRNKFAENTRPPLPDNVIEFPGTGRDPDFVQRLNTMQRFESLRSHIHACLTPLQAKVIDCYYSPAAPDLRTVAQLLGVSLNTANKAHSLAVRTLRERLKTAA